ncbi:transposase [Kitasatospora sp. NPDC096147]|uniref:transposase n=1 Tax=Kitasatospora sp. NPDC096147 TaxID=3364093 RepID=UPI003814253B
MPRPGLPPQLEAVASDDEIALGPPGAKGAPWIVNDDPWSLIEPLLRPRPQRAPDPQPVDDQLPLWGVLSVPFIGIAWQQLPPKRGFGSGQTCRRRLCRWTEAGVFDQVHQILLAVEHGRADRLDAPLR